MKKLLAALLFLIATAAYSVPATPTIRYPTTGLTNAKWNPTIFWTVFTCPDHANEVQLDFQIQIATENTFQAANIVYETDNGGGATPDCRTGNDCYGAGMAHYVTSEPSYAGLFENALAGQTKLATNTVYYIRMRVMGEDGTWSAFSSTSSFTTVQYNGTQYYVNPSGLNTNDCLTSAAPGSGGVGACADIGYVINVKIGAGTDTGAVVNVAAGTYALPIAGDVGTSDFDYVANSGNFPDRIWVKGASAPNRPVIQANANPADDTNVQWIWTAMMRDVIWENLIFSGHPDCCTSTCESVGAPLCYNNAAAFDHYIWQFDTNAAAEKPARFSFINVDFIRNFTLSNNNGGGGATGPPDVLFKNVNVIGTPTYDFVNAYDNANRVNDPLMAINSPQFWTLKNYYADSYGNGIGFNGDTAYGVWTDGVLFEDTRIDRNSVHPLRPSYMAKNWTLRRFVKGAGLESLDILDSSVNVENLVIENSVLWGNGPSIWDPTTRGTLNYFVMQNTIFVDAYPDPTGSGTSAVFMKNDTGGVVIDSADRVQYDYNGYRVHSGVTDGILVKWFPVTGSCTSGDVNCYSPRGGTRSQNWDAWLVYTDADHPGSPYDQNSPFALYDTTKKEPPNPLFVTQPSVTGGQGGVGDFNLQAASPMINAGHPDYRAPTGDGSRVDIGAYEYSSAPESESDWDWDWGWGLMFLWGN